MCKKVISIVLSLALGVSSIFAQTRKVTGTITDVNGEAVPAATVMVQGTKSGTTADSDGKYSISAQKGAVLEFSSIGYVSVTVKVGDSDVIDVRLSEDRTVLEDAVVVGYGSARKVSSIVGSVATVKSDIIKNAPSASALDQLQGQVAGLSVLSYSGVAGDNSVSITLHGVGSISSSSTPLYVIDGIPSSSRSVMAMNPYDIQSVSVLKDASATSIYGSRAANGVIYIATKNGSYNEKASVTVRSQWGVSTLANLKLYKNMMSGDELRDFWIRSGIHSADWVKRNFINKGFTANTKWYKEFMDLVNPQSQNDVTIEGGGRKVAYMIGLSQYYQKGFTPGNYYNRYTVRNNVQAHPFTWLKVGSNFNFSLDKTQQNPYWGSAANGPSNYVGGGLSYLLNPLYPAAKNEDGNWYTYLNTATPKYYMDTHKDAYDRYGVNGNFFVEIEPVRNLKFTSRAGVDGYIRLNNWKTLPSYVSAHGGTTTAGKSSQYEYSATITNTVEYSLNIADLHNVSLLLGQEGVDNDYSYFYATADGQTDDRQMLLQHGTSSSRDISESASQSRFLSFFAHAAYDYDSKYFLDATVRNDAVSRFGKDKRNAQFWSVGAKWSAKKENFLKDVRWVNALEAKVSYGTQGNASIGNYPSLGLITNSGSYHDVSARYVSQPANDKLTWENQALFTVGTSGRIFDRFDFDISYYYRKTTDMLMKVPQPYTSGFTSVTQNVGGMRNSGLDVTLGVDIIRSREAYLRFNTTFNYNSQKLLSLFDNRDRWVVANTSVAYVVGNPIMFYSPIYAGVDKETGAPTWYVPGENVDKTTKKETTTTFDSEALEQNTGKKRYAPINGGFSLAGGWKNISFQADFTYVIGKYLISNDGIFYANPVKFNNMNTNKAVSNFWTPEHKDAKYPDWSKGYSMQFDTHLLENASFMRLKNFQVAYALPKSWLGWSNNVLKGVKFTFTGRNLLTFTNYSGIDPEVNSNLTVGVAGNSKQFLGGVEITF